MSDTLQSLRDGILTRFPWGYFTRVVAILGGKNTASLPSFTVEFHTSASETETLAFNPSDMLTGGAALITAIEDPIYGVNARTIFEPMVQLVVALSVIFTIFSDVAGTHKHHSEGSGGKKTKLS